MTRNTNNTMRKMAVTGLTLLGLALGGLGTVGCDVPGGEELARALSLDGASVFQVMDSDWAAGSYAAKAGIIISIPRR